MSRYQPTNYENLTEDRQELFQSIASSRSLRPSQTLGGPFDPWLESAEMARRLVGLGDFFRFRTSVDRRYIELAILVTGQFWQAQFEWFAHKNFALEAGLARHVIDSIQNHERPNFANDDEAAVYDFSVELQKTHQVSDAGYNAVMKHIGQAGAVDLVGLLGYYTLVSMTLNVYQVNLPDGEPPPLSP